MGYHNICSKLDRAIVAYLVDQGVGTSTGADANLYSAKKDADKILPSAVVISDDFREDPPRSRNFTVQVDVHVRTLGWNDSGVVSADTETVSETWVQNVFDCFYPSEDQDGSVLAASITAAAAGAGISDFTCTQAVVKGGDRGQSGKEGVWIDTINIECYCEATTVAG